MWVPRFSTIPDRVTWAVLTWILINLIWLKYLEGVAPQWVCAIVATAAAVALAVLSPGPKEEADEVEAEPDAKSRPAEPRPTTEGKR
jgi:hypothetical protein